MHNKTHEKRLLKDILALPRKLIREVKTMHVENIRALRKKTGYVANIFLARLPDKTEMIIGSNHLLDSLKNEDPNTEIWVEVVDVQNEIELNMVAEAHNFHISLTDYEKSKVIANEVINYGEEYVRKKRRISKDRLRKIIKMANIPTELGSYIPPAKSKATIDCPLTYSHWRYIINELPEKDRVPIALKLIFEVQESGDIIKANELREALPFLKDNPDIKIKDALSTIKRRNVMNNIGLGIDSKEKYETIEKLTYRLNPIFHIVYDIGAKEVFRLTENGQAVETELPRLEKKPFIEKITLVGNELTRSGSEILSYAGNNPKIDIYKNGNSDFYDFLLNLDYSTEHCLFVIDFSGLGISVSALGILFRKRPYAHVVMTVVNLWEGKHCRASIPKFLCDMNEENMIYSFDEYLEKAIEKYKQIGYVEVFKMKNNEVVLMHIKQQNFAIRSLITNARKSK